jgi:hypothetical protein
VDHLSSLGETYAAALAFHVLRKAFLPLMRLLFLLENNPSDRPVVSVQQRDVRIQNMR